MRRFVMYGLALLMVMSSLAGAWAQEGQGQEKKLEKEFDKEKGKARAFGVLYDLEKHLTGMDETIAFAKEKGLDTTKLVALRNDFQSAVKDVEDITKGGSDEKLGPAVSNARRIANDFREEGRRVLGKDLDEARRRVANATARPRPVLLNETYAQRARAVLKEFDEHVAHYERIVGRLSNATDVTEAQAKLAEIKGQRPALVEALKAAATSCIAQNVPPRACNTPEKQELEALVKEIQKDFQELQKLLRNSIRGGRILEQVRGTRHLLEQMNARLDKLAEKGVDVTAYKAKLGEVDRLLTSAEDEAKAGKWDEAERDLKAAHEALRSILKDLGKEQREFLKDLREEKKENVTARIKERKEEVKERRENVTERLKEQRENRTERRENIREEGKERREEMTERRENRTEKREEMKERLENRSRVVVR